MKYTIPLAFLVMTLGLMLDGALLGALFSQRLAHPVLQWAMVVMFFAARAAAFNNVACL